MQSQRCKDHYDSRKGDTIASEGDVSIAVPAIHPWLTPLLTVLPLQLMAYETAVKLGRDVDIHETSPNRSWLVNSDDGEALFTLFQLKGL